MIQDRKLDHINICLKEDIESTTGPGFSDMTLVHRAAPELDMNEISLETSFLGNSSILPSFTISSSSIRRCVRCS